MHENITCDAQPSPPARKGKGRKLRLLILASVLLVLAIASGVTLAWLADSDSLTNTFEASRVMLDVVETMNEDRTEKTNVSIQNTSLNPDLSCYIRAIVVVHWEREENGVVYTAAVSPKDGTDYSIVYNDTTWELGDDGFWYFLSPVDSQETTDILIRSCKLIDPSKVLTTDDGKPYHLSVEIVAGGIQAEPDTAVTTAWASGVSGVDSNGNLIVK